MQHPSTSGKYTDGWRDRMSGNDHAPTNEPNYERGWRDADFRIWLDAYAECCDRLSLTAQPQVA